jgi:Xaa-Pro aminopeptidase
VVGLERMPLPIWRALVDGVKETEMIDVGASLAMLRRLKSPFEVDRLRAAARLTDAMLDAARSSTRAGISESELAAQLSTIALAAGGRCAFETTVVSGTQQPIPIRLPTTRRINRGDTVMIDLGAEVDGYQADATRTFVVGSPTSIQETVWSVVLAAYEAVIELARPGVPCRELHMAGASVVAAAGYQLAHRIGHGIGLATSYEWPSLDTEESPLEPGVTICIEPGIYTPGAGNMKLEDDVLITATGYEMLTRSDRGVELSA